MNVLVIGRGGREHALAWKFCTIYKSEKGVCSTGQ